MGIGRIIWGLVITAVGVLVTIKSEWFLQNFGTIQWAEENLGYDGGSRLFYKLLGLALAIIGLLMATGLLGGIVLGTIGRLFVPGNAPIN